MERIKSKKEQILWYLTKCKNWFNRLEILIFIESIILFVVGILLVVSNIIMDDSIEWELLQLVWLLVTEICIILGFFGVYSSRKEIESAILKKFNTEFFFKEYVSTVEEETAKLSNTKVDNQYYKVDFMYYYDEADFCTDKTMKPLVLAVCLMLSILDNKQVKQKEINKNLAMNCAIASISKEQREAIDEKLANTDLNTIDLIGFVFSGRWTLKGLVGTLNAYEESLIKKANNIT